MKFEVDGGCGETLMSLQEYQDKFQNHHKNLISIGSLSLSTFTEETVRPLGSFIATVVIDGVEYGRLEVLVVDTGKRFTALLGRTWLDVVNPSWRELLSPRKNIPNISKMSYTQGNDTQSDTLIKNIREKFPYTVSQDTNQTIVGFKAQILLEPCQPIFHKAYSVPYRSREKVEQELERLCNENILEPVKNSKWASPIVVVPKGKDSVRLCMDAKVTINKFIKTEHYPLPLVDDIFVSLANSRFFCVIDLKNAYLQLEVEEESRECLTINTLRGLFRYKRLLFGVASAPAIFQSVIDQVLKDIDGCVAYLDDIVIGSSTQEGCKRILFQVLSKLNDHKILINLDKCQFLVKSVKYLGHVLEDGHVSPNPDKIKAIVEAPAPSDVAKLSSYLGLINYYRKFLPNLSTELHPLYNLLKSNVKYQWDEQCQAAFQKSKELLINSLALTLFDPNKETVLSCDASPYGLGACLSQMVNGEERPVSFASASLSPSEKNYSQLHREALAIIFGVKKFQKYLYGKCFTLVTDNQAIREIFNPKKNTPAVAAARLQRWAVQLSMFNYKIVYRPGKKMGNVDALSRLPIQESHEVESIPVNNIRWDNSIQIDFEKVKLETKKDPEAKQVSSYLANGSGGGIPSEFKRVQNQLSLEDQCIFYGERLFIPKNLRLAILELLHENHSGMVLMKKLARSYVWWPSIDKSIEDYVRSCEICQQTGTVKKEKLNSKWPECSVPFERVHLDLFYFGGKMFLIIVDSFSNYIDIVLMNNTTARSLIKVLEDKFAIYGLFHEIVTDNGPPFNSWEFEKYCRERSIRLSHSPIYHPASNGRAERGVRIVKTVFRKFLLTSKDTTIEQKIQKFLLHYRNSPNSTTSQSPNELIYSYKPRTQIDNLNPKKKVSFDLSKNKYHSQNQNNEVSQNKNHSQSYSPEFKENEKALYKNHEKSIVRWLPCIIKQKLSKLRYLISLDSKIKMVHVNQLKKYFSQYNTDLIVYKSKEAQPNLKKRVRKQSVVEPFTYDGKPLRKKRKIYDSENIRRSERIKEMLKRKQLECQMYKS